MFCKYCGTQLHDGEACQCAASQKNENAPSTIPPMIDANATRSVSANMFQEFFKKVLRFVYNQKKFTLVVGIVALILVILFSSGKKSELNGTWVLNKDTFAGGIILEIKDGTITAQGNMLNYFGRMNYNYEVKSDTEMVLRYNWNFTDWVWSFPRASEIPVKYSLNEAGDQLTIRWDGTDFVLLDNVEVKNEAGIGNDGAIVVEKSGQIVFYRDDNYGKS